MGRLQPLAALLAAGQAVSASFHSGKYLLGYNVDSVEVCYTYITVIPASPTPGPGPGFVTTTVENPDITGPVTFTVPPSGTTPGTVVVETPPVGTVTVITGNPSITAPTTRTVPASGTVPGTVIIETPEPDDPLTVTITTGNPTITAPTTRTVPASGTVPGTVIIETPEPGDPLIVTFTTGNPTITAPITRTIPPTGTVPGTVIVETPDPAPETNPPIFVTITTGNPTITGPQTQTVPPTGTVPGTVIVETPEPPVDPGTVTLTTENPTITGPTTITVPASGTVPGTVIVETPPFDPGTVTLTTGNPTITGPTTVTVPASGTVPGTVIVETPEPTTPPAFSCDAGGYLIQAQTLFRLDLTTGETELVNQAVGPGRQINAIGYNVLDNFIYGMLLAGQGATSADLIRIDANGDTVVFPVGLTGNWRSGDVDSQGRLWLHDLESGWAVVDADPDSPTFAEVLDQGTSPLPAGYTVADWAFVPGGGDFLYSVIYSEGESALARWGTDTNTWEIIEEYGVVTDGEDNDTWGALYSAGNGFLYASENNSGDIWRFPVLAGGAPQFVVEGPESSNNDGARCVNAPDPPFDEGQAAARVAGEEASSAGSSTVVGTASSVEASAVSGSASSSASASASD